MQRFLKTAQSRFPRFRVKLLLSILTLGIMIFISEVIVLQSSLAGSRKIRFSPPPPPERGAPGQRGQAASRGCRPNEQSLTALAPTWETTLNQDQGDSIPLTNVFGLTTQAQPALWFYVPKAKIASVEFSLQSEAGKTLYRTQLTLPDRPGIIPVKLPSTSPLEANQRYRWFFKMRFTCEPQQPVQLTYAEGWIQRVNSPDLVDRLKQATPEERAGLYAEKGIWFDSVTALAELRLAKPNDPDLTADWSNLLKSVNLEALSKQPIVR